MGLLYAVLLLLAFYSVLLFTGKTLVRLVERWEASRRPPRAPKRIVLGPFRSHNGFDDVV